MGEQLHAGEDDDQAVEGEVRPRTRLQVARARLSLERLEVAAELVETLVGSVKNLGRYAASWMGCWPKPQRRSSTAALT